MKNKITSEQKKKIQPPYILLNNILLALCECVSFQIKKKEEEKKEKIKLISTRLDFVVLSLLASIN